MPLLFLIALLQFTKIGKISANVAPDGDLYNDFMLKLQILEEKLTTNEARYLQTNQDLQLKLQAMEQNLEANKHLCQVEIQSLRSELMEREKTREKKENAQQKIIEDLQAGLQSTSEDYAALKGQFVKFLKVVSSTNKTQGSQNSAGYTEKGSANPNNGDPINVGIEKETDGTADNFDTAGEATTSVVFHSGVTYTRWARTSCEGDARTLYTGYSAGKQIHSREPHAGSEYICLHSKPQWSNVVQGVRNNHNLVGVEYEFYDDDPFSKENNGGRSLRNHDMPCTVCHVSTRSQQIMIPGRITCPNGWTKEYGGYLGSTSYYYYGTPYICIDQAPEVIPGAAAAADVNPQQVVTVEASCQGLNCPPYYAGHEISCTVCSK